MKFVENIYKHSNKHTNDRQPLQAMRVTVLLFSLFVLGYAMASRGTKIYDMVSGACEITVVGAFVPLVFGVYWKRATTLGALA